jgi:hypothetical protein
MKKDTTYNGWTNYATWLVNMDMFTCLTISDFYPDTVPDILEFTRFLEQYVIDTLDDDNQNTICISYALAFVSNVNWYEIAEHLIQNKE